MIYALIILATILMTGPAQADPLSALIVGAIGLTGTAATIGTAVLTTAFGVGLQFAANRLRPKEKTGATAARVGLKVDTNAPRQFIIGETATGGSLAFWHLSGSDNQKLWMVIVLADHECTSLQSVIVTGKNKSWNSSTGVVDGYSNKLKVRFYPGAASPTADAALVAASGGRWTSSEVGSNVCYVVVEADFDEKVFPDGIPELGFVVRGAKLYDPRTGTTAYSANPAVAIYNLLRGIVAGGEPLLGMNVAASAIRLSEAQAAANACDEAVALKAGGTELRYRCNVILDCDQTSRDHIEVILASMAGEVIESGGIYRIMAGVAQSPIASISDDDLISGEPLTYRPRRGRNQLVNAVTGSYFEPSRNYSPVGLPPRTSSTNEDEDGGIRLTTTLDLAAVTSRTQAQRIQEIERKKARRMGSLGAQLRARWFVLEPGDWITFTSNRRGFVSKTFELSTSSGVKDLRSNIVLSEIDAGFDDWSTALEIDDSEVIDLPPAGPSFTTVTGVALANFVVAGDGAEQRPGLRITWTPVTDPTIVRLDLEYRKIGDTVALERPIADPFSGSYAWLDGIQGGVQYEARLKPVPVPDRATSFTAWAQVPADSGAQVVSAAALALAVPPDTITPEMLTQQTRIEIALSSATEAVTNSVTSRINEAIRQVQEASAAAIGIASENQRLIRAVKATSGANAIAITETLEAVGGAAALSARWAVAIDLNGNVTGLVQLSGDLDYSQFTVIADKFAYAFPGINGGLPTPVFAIATVEGDPTVVINGDLIANAIRAGLVQAETVDAVFGSFGVMTAGTIRNATGTSFWNLDTGDFQIS